VSDLAALLLPVLTAFAVVAASSDSGSLDDCILDRFLFRSFRLDTCSPSVTCFPSGFVGSDTSFVLTAQSDFTSEDSFDASAADLGFENDGFSPSLKVRRLFAAETSSLDSAILSLARRFLPRPD